MNIQKNALLFGKYRHLLVEEGKKSIETCEEEML